MCFTIKDKKYVIIISYVCPHSYFVKIIILQEVKLPFLMISSEKAAFLAFKVTKFLREGDPKFDLTSADGDSAVPEWRWTVPLSRLHPQICHHPHLKDERQTQEDGETDGEISGSGRRWRRWWRKEEKRSQRVSQSAFILTWASRCTSSHPWQTSTAKHQREKGQPGAMGSHHGAKLSSIPLYTHTHPNAIPTLIPHAPLTSLLKHRSKSPDWSQRLRNKWRQIPDSCMAFFCREAWEGLQPPDLAFHLCKYIPYWKCGSRQSTWFWVSGDLFELRRAYRPQAACQQRLPAQIMCVA